MSPAAPASPIEFHSVTRMAGRKLLTAGQERDLARRRDEGDPEARNELVLRNLRLAVNVASRFWHRAPIMPLDDFIEEAVLGLMKAADRFDPDRGRFTTIARRWIIQAIDLGMTDGGRLVRVPRDMQHALRSGRFTASSTRAEGDKGLENAARANRAVAHGFHGASRGDDATHHLHVADDLGSVVERDRSERVGRIVDSLPGRLGPVVRLYYGLDGPPLLQREIGELMGLDRTMINLDLKRALALLREILEADPEAR